MFRYLLLNSGGTISLPSGSIGSSDLADSAVVFSKLAANVFGDQVQTLTNAGTAGGSMSYINLGGIKLLWGKTLAKGGSAPYSQYGITLPSSFFSSITGGGITASNFNGSYEQTVGFDSNNPTTTTANIAIKNKSGASATIITYYFLIGT